MENKIKDLKKIFVNPNSRIKLFIIVGFIGVLLIFLSEMIPQKHNETVDKTSVSYADYIDELEDKTQNIISSIDGVGECEVMITLVSSNESVYAKNTDEKNDSSSISKSYEYVLYDSTNGDEPILIKEYFPSVQGVVVVCSGGDNNVVCERIISSVSSLYNLPSSRITVSKLKG